MNRADIESFASAYIEFVRTPRDSTRHDDLFWTFDLLVDAARLDPELCWTLILAVLAKDATEETIGAVAAGPMEDLLANHGRKMIALVEEKANADPVFRRMILGVWRNKMDDEVWSRLQVLKLTKN